MSRKIIEARIEELERLKQLKEDLKEKINKKGKMEEIRDAIERGGTAEIILSSSAAALNNRGKESSNFTNVLGHQKSVVERLHSLRAEPRGLLNKVDTER